MGMGQTPYNQLINQLFQEEGEKKAKVQIVKENITADTVVMDVVPPSKDMMKTSKKK